MSKDWRDQLRPALAEAQRREDERLKDKWVQHQVAKEQREEQYGRRS